MGRLRHRAPIARPTPAARQVLQLLVQVPGIGRVVGWLYRKQHELRLKLRKRRAERLARVAAQREARASLALASARSSARTSSAASAEGSSPSRTASIRKRVASSFGKPTAPSASAGSPGAQEASSADAPPGAS